MLPTRSGFSPFLLVYKQEPRWGGWGESAGVGVPDLADEEVAEHLLA